MKKIGLESLGLLLVCMLALSGCDSGPDHRPVTTAKAAKKQIADRFKDPDSVLFRKVSMDADRKHLCGELNAKNGFGAYTGYDTFRAEIEGVGDQVSVGSILTGRQELARIKAAISAGTERSPGEAIMKHAFDMLCAPGISENATERLSIEFPD